MPAGSPGWGRRGSAAPSGGGARPGGRWFCCGRCVFLSKWVKGHTSAVPHGPAAGPRPVALGPPTRAAEPPRLPAPLRSESRCPGRPTCAGFLPSGERSAAGLRCSPLPACSRRRSVSVKREIKLKGNGRRGRRERDRTSLHEAFIPASRAFVLRCVESARGCGRLHPVSALRAELISVGS